MYTTFLTLSTLLLTCQSLNTKCPRPNEVWSDCKNDCLDSCPTDPATLCSLNCNSGCTCKPGYKRYKNGPCILTEKCPCPNKNEVFRYCGIPCMDACTDGIGLPSCAFACIDGCYCRDGYKRDPSTGKCVLERQCPGRKIQRCRQNEEWTCSNWCLNDCNIGLGRPCILGCTDGCYCKNGFKRYSGECIPEKNCPPLTQLTGCPNPNQQELRNGNECKENCLQPKDKCPDTLEYKCHCKSGLKLNPYTGECVPPKFCPRS